MQQAQGAKSQWWVSPGKGVKGCVRCLTNPVKYLTSAALKSVSTGVITLFRSSQSDIIRGKEAPRLWVRAQGTDSQGLGNVHRGNLEPATCSPLSLVLHMANEGNNNNHARGLLLELHTNLYKSLTQLPKTWHALEVSYYYYYFIYQ